MTATRPSVARLFAPVLLVMALSLPGCAPVILYAVGLGKTLVTLAAVKFTVKAVDNLIGENSKSRDSDVRVDQDDPERGIIPRLTFQKRDDKGKAIGLPVEMTEVPVYRGRDGQWHAEKYYTEQKIAPAVEETKKR